MSTWMAGACVGSRPWKPDSAGEVRFDTGTCRDAGHEHGEPENTEHQGLRVVGCEESRDDPSVSQREVENHGYYQQSDD